MEYMKIALKLAQKAYALNEMPIGAVIIKDNKIIAKAYNEKEKYKDATKHAEIICIQRASRKLKDWRLNNCIMYVTLEPCNMCLGAIIESRISRVIYDTENVKNHDINKKILLNSELTMEKGKSFGESKKLLDDFFKSLRNSE